MDFRHSFRIENNSPARSAGSPTGKNKGQKAKMTIFTSVS